MSESNADSLEQLQQRRSAKWRGFDKDVLPLPVAEMDFPIAQPIKDALIDMIQRSDVGYGGIIPEFGLAFSQFSKDFWDWDVDPQQIRLATDVGVAGVEVLRAVCWPGDKVVINSPVYHNFYNWIKEAHCDLIDVPLSHDGNGTWTLNFEALEKAFADGAKVYLLCSPHNPMGTVFTREELVRIAALAKKYNVVVISDEIHAPLTFVESFVPFLAVSDEAREVGICITAASKTWNLAGLKCAQIVTDNVEMHAKLDALPISVPWRASILGAWASTVAYNDGREWLADIMGHLKSNQKFLKEQLALHVPKARYFMSDSTYLAWIDLSAYGIDDPAKVLVEKGRVAFNDGADFGPDGKNHIRLNFATSQEILAEAIKRMASVLEA